MKRTVIPLLLATIALHSCRTSKTNSSENLRIHDSISISRTNILDISRSVLSGHEICLDSALIVISDYPDGTRRTVIATPRFKATSEVTDNGTIRGSSKGLTEVSNSTEDSSWEEKESHSGRSIPLWLPIVFIAGVILLLSWLKYRIRK